MQKYYQSEPKFTYPTNNLPKTKDGGYAINQYKSIGTHLIALYGNGDNITYFDSFQVE